MSKRGKKYEDKAKDSIEKTLYSLSDGIQKVKKNSYSKFDGSIDLHIKIAVPTDKDPKSIKGSISLPHSVKTEAVKVIVFCPKEEAEKAKKSGAIEAGLEDLIKKIQGGWMDFDVAIAVPSVMAQIAILGKDLGPKGLMPNPKTGTLTEDIEKALDEFKKGKTKFSCDSSGVIHLSVGKIGMEDKMVIENILYTIKQIASVIGRQVTTLVKSVSIAPTMGKSVKIKLDEFED